ncbi:MAG: hypothetical protein WA125_14360 [Desulfosporosinus sp.]
MLAVALNYLGSGQERELGPALRKLFNDFKRVKFSPWADLEEGPLQLCQPQGNEDLMKDIQKSWNPAEALLELRGPKAKLLRALRSMFYFDKAKEYHNVFLEGGQGVDDFPWAIQIVMLQLPVLVGEYDPEVIRKADILVINGSDQAEIENFSAEAKKIQPEIPIFTEKVQVGLSQDIKACLEALFAANLAKRDSIKTKLELRHPDKLLSCTQARSLSDELGFSSFLVGSVCDELGYRITNCWLGCF